MSHACSFTSAKILKFGVRTVTSLNYFRLAGKSYSRQMAMDKIHHDRSRGALIVLEGLDRSGKSSQCSRLVSHLEGKGISVEAWRFPDRRTNIGTMISSYLANESQLDDQAVHLLFSANRWEKRLLMENKLWSGTTLVVDRYSYSGVAFSAAKGLDIEWCKAPETGLIAPDLVLYLDLPPEEASKRGGYGIERYEQLEFQRCVAHQYQKLRDTTWKVEDIEIQLRKFALECIETCQNKIISTLWPSK
uniref:Thymidylate kinase n=1 Tax=Elaeis guineensis var. tenera TaxID=51953 RepID=A0A8N4I6P1_ELAGV|nr:thymidylate kinase isoform X2 [Elaeis guineensis]XP_029117868.1 thymidylate kinase isoform X2 [Elaeis guineensis]